MTSFKYANLLFIKYIRSLNFDISFLFLRLNLRIQISLMNSNYYYYNIFISSYLRISQQLLKENPIR